MNDKRIVYQGEDGIAKIVIPTKEYKGTMEDLLKKVVPEDCLGSADIVEVDTIPNDRTFRNAWTTSKGKSAEIDLAKAKEEAKIKVRQARTPKFQELDIAYQRADEDGDADVKKAVADKKTVLRDATKNTKITGASDVDKLKEGMESVIKEVQDLKV
tara:strand:+ start:72 stop:542 length:471 start_codon:yes stop_codon:yes gene_type:complete